MERSDPPSRSAPPPRSAAAAAYSNNVCTNGARAGGNAFTSHDNDFGGPRSERYSKIFESFRSGKALSIPMLDLPPFDDSGAAAFDLVYSDIFGGFDLPDFALSLDDLIRRSDGRKESSESDTRTQIGTKSVSEESDPSACTGRDQYFPNVDFHQTADDKFNLSYHKVNMVTTEDSNVIHVAKHSPVLGNSYIYEGSTLLKEDGGRYSSGFDDNIILCEDSSGKSVDAQSKSVSNLSHDNGGKNGRPHGINHSQTVVSDSDIYLNMERSHVLRTSSEPRTAAVMNNDPFSSMSDSKCPKDNASKALFDVSSLDFLNAELSTGSYGIASAAAIKEAMETTKIKLKSARESTERKKDSAKGTRPFMKNDMNANGKMRMVFDDSILRDCEQVKSGRKEEQQSDVCLKKESESLKLGRSDNADEIEDEETEKEMKMPALASESENSRSTYEDPAINEEQKMDKVDLHAELKSTEEYSYEGRHLNAQSESSTSSTGSYPLYVTNNKVPEMTCEYEKNIATEDAENTGQFRRKEEFERAHLREHELERERERDRYLEKERVRQLEKEREQDREKKLKFHFQRLEELRERKRETEVDKDCRRKLEEERRGERERTLEKKNIGKLDVEWEREREREKDRMVGKLKTSAAHERVFTEADEMTEQAAAEIATAETRQRSVAEARERLEKACAVAREKYLSEKASTESQLRAERAAVARATAEARERAIEKAMAEKDSFEAPEQVARSASEKFSSSLEDLELRHTSSSSDLWNSDMTDEVEGESAHKGRANLERHRRTVERVAKALAEKSTQDLIAQKEHAERNRLAECLDADIKRWSNGKEGNLRALLSTLQYILGPDSGWHPIPLTEIISSAAVKKAYRKATLCVHPDKLQQRGASTQQKYICEKVFELLKDSWNRFNSEER